jgi:hypothetical protein
MVHKKQQTTAAGASGTASTAAAAAAAADSSAVTRSTGNMTYTDVLHAQRAKWPEGYVAVCAVVKDQNRDLRYWIEYHRCDHVVRRGWLCAGSCCSRTFMPCVGGRHQP